MYKSKEFTVVGQFHSYQGPKGLLTFYSLILGFQPHGHKMGAIPPAIISILHAMLRGKGLGNTCQMSHHRLRVY